MRLSIFLLLATACAPANPVPEGTTIDGTSITSCADDLIDEAPPAGALEGTLVVTSAGTTLTGKLYWQASCPLHTSSAQTQFAMSQATIYRDDAGFPGAQIGQTDVDFEGVASCSDRATVDIGGVTSSLEFDPTAVTSLAALCAEWKSSPQGSPLYAQVELTGTSTTCSDQSYPLLFRSQVAVTCP